jgi:hypothetical protein
MQLWSLGKDTGISVLGSCLGNFNMQTRWEPIALTLRKSARNALLCITLGLGCVGARSLHHFLKSSLYLLWVQEGETVSWQWSFRPWSPVVLSGITVLQIQPTWKALFLSYRICLQGPSGNGKDVNLGHIIVFCVGLWLSERNSFSPSTV